MELKAIACYFRFNQSICARPSIGHQNTRADGYLVR